MASPNMLRTCGLDVEEEYGMQPKYKFFGVFVTVRGLHAAGRMAEIAEFRGDARLR